MNDWPICFRVTDTVWAIYPGCAVLHVGPSMPLVIGIDAAILPRADIERRRREGLELHIEALLAKVAHAARKHGERNVSLRN